MNAKQIRYGLLSFGLIAILAIAYFLFRISSSRPDQSLLTGTSFSEPGWHSIVPGSTTREEAWQILKRSSYVRQTSIWSTEAKYDPGLMIESVYWDNQPLALISTTNTDSNRMIVIDDKVRLIDIHLDYEVRVDQIITHFGNPQKIMRCKQQDNQGGLYTAIYLWYGDNGLALQSMGAYSVEGLLVPDSYVIETYYFEPMSLDDFVSELGTLAYLCQEPQIQDWTGYDPIPTPSP